MSDLPPAPDGLQHSGPTLPSLQQSLQQPGSKRYRSTPAKTFQCTGFGDCRMVFSRSEHLARHIRKHTGERPFTCHCSKQFSRLDNLRQHAQTVHADKPEQNEKMMKELTSLHSSMSAASGTAKRPSKRAARVAEMASQQQFAPQDAPPPRPPSGFDHNANPYGAHHPAAGPVPFPGQHMPYLPQDGAAHYAHHQQPYGDPHASYQTSYPMSDSFSSSYHHHQQGPPPPQLHVQPGYPMYDYNHRTGGSDGESPVDNHPPPNSAHDSHPSQSPATPTSGIVPPSATSLHAPHPQSAAAAYGQYTHPHHHHHNGIPYPSRSPLPTPPPQSFRQPLRGVRDGAAGGDYYQPPTLPQQHSYQHYVQQRQSISTPHLPGSSPSPHPGASGSSSSSVTVPDNSQIKREEYAHLPPLVKAEQYEPSNNNSNYRFHDGGSNGIPSRASSTSLPEQRDTGQHLSRFNGGGSSPPPLVVVVGHQHRGGNDSAAGVSAGSFGGEQRFPSEFYDIQHQEQQQHGQHFRGRPGHLPQHDSHGHGSTTAKEHSPPDQHVPVSPVDLDEANDRPGTAPAAFTHNGQSLARPATSASSSSPAPAQSSRFASHAMATTTTADKYYAGISGFREPVFDHAPPSSSAAATGSTTAGPPAAFEHNRGSNSPPFRFGAPSPQQGRVDLEHQQYQSTAASFATVRRSPTGGTLGATSASSRPGNVLRPLPGWTNSAPVVGSVHAASDSPFSFHPPPSLSHSFSSTNSRKRPYPDDESSEQPRPVSSRPATRSGLDDEQPRPTSRRLSVMELCNTRSGGGGSGLPDGFDNRPRTSSGRFPAPSASGNPSGNGPSSSFSFPASPSNANFSHHHPNGLRPSSSSGTLSTTAFQLAPPVGSSSGGGSASAAASSSSIFAYSLPGNASTGPSGGGSRPSSSAGRGLEQYSLNLGASSRPGTASAQWNSSRGPNGGGGGGDDEPGLKAGSGIVLPPLHLSSTSPTTQSAGTFGSSSGHDASGGFGRGGDGRSRDGLAGGFVAHQSRVPTSPHGLRA